MTGATRAHNRARGFALIIVLWFLVLTGAIGIYLILHARSETAIAHNLRAAAGAEALADDGVVRAAFNQLDPVTSNRWRLDGGQHLLSLPAGSVSIRLADETQKINPNLASEGLLAALFEASGVDRNRARHLGAAVADWVSPDGPARELGAKREQYRAAGKTYGPPNAPLETLDDLNLVLGMTPQILALVRPYLTLYSQSGVPNAKGAPFVVQRAMALAGSGGDDAEEPAAAGTANAKPPAAGQGEHLIAVEATAQSRDGGTYVRTAVLRLAPGSLRGYDILDWQRGSLPAENVKLSD